MATQWQPTGTLSLNPPGTNIFDRNVFGAINAARGQGSSNRSWQSAMNSGIRRQQTSARRGDPRSLLTLSRLGPAQRVGSALDARGVAQTGIDQARIAEENAAYEESLRGAALGFGPAPAWGAPGPAQTPLMAPGGAGSSWGGVPPTSIQPAAPMPVKGEVFDTAAYARSQGRVPSLPGVQPVAIGNVRPAASVGAPTQAMAPVQPTMFDIARGAVERRMREQQEQGTRTTQLPGGTQKMLPGIGTSVVTNSGERAIKGRYGSGFSTPTAEAGVPKSFDGMPGLSFFQEAANRQGIGNKFAEPQANSRQNLLAAAMQRAYESGRYRR